MSNPGIPKSITEGIKTLEEAMTAANERIKKIEEKGGGLKVGNYSNARNVPEHEEVELSATKDAVVIMKISAPNANEVFEVNPNQGSGGGAFSYRSNSGTAEHPEEKFITFILEAGKKYRWTQGSAGMSVTEWHAIID